MTADPHTRDIVECVRLPVFAAADLHAARAAFRTAMPVSLAQAWLDESEPDFAPGTVRTGWRDDTLLVFAELSDADIFTRARRHNERFWELGDTFELFLQPETGSAYVEFHVTPSNLRLQLRFSAPPAPDVIDHQFDQAIMHEEVFRSHAWVNGLAREWCVLAEIPARAIGGRSLEGRPEDSAPEPSLAGASWRVSFCRYDYTRGRARPVISSSSPHTEPRFHRPHEWNELRFKSS